MPLKLLPTPIGNLEDITYRTVSAFQEAQTVLCEDTRVAKKLLTLLSKRLSIDFGNKNFVSLHAHNEDATIFTLEDRLRNEKCVYASDAGMPCISDPGAKLVKFCQEKNIPYEVLPGANACVTAFAASGILDGKFAFYGFLPHKSEARKEQIKKLSLIDGFSIVLYEAPHRILQLIDELCLLLPTREMFLCKELTKMHERHFWGKAEDIKKQLSEKNIQGEWCVVLSASNEPSNTLQMGAEDILQLDLPKKEQARLLAKIGPKTAKEYYDDLVAAAK